MAFGKQLVLIMKMIVRSPVRCQYPISEIFRIGDTVAQSTLYVYKVSNIETV